MKIKKIFIVLILILLTNSISLAENIKIGIILPLSGLLSEYGISSKNGFELAKKENPELFKNIKFVYEDIQYSPSLAISAYNKLRMDENVKLIYNWGANTSAVLTPLAEKECFPLFLLDFSTNTLKNTSCVVSFSPRAFDLGVKLSEYLNKNNFKKIGIISTENLYINGIIDGVAGNYTYEDSKETGKRLVSKIYIKKISGDFYEVIE